MDCYPSRSCAKRFCRLKMKVHGMLSNERMTDTKMPLRTHRHTHTHLDRREIEMVVLCAGYIHDISLVNVGPSHQHQHKSDEHSLPNTENQSTKYFIRKAKERARASCRCSGRLWWLCKQPANERLHITSNLKRVQIDIDGNRSMAATVVHTNWLLKMKLFADDYLFDSIDNHWIIHDGLRWHHRLIITAARFGFHDSVVAFSSLWVLVRKLYWNCSDLYDGKSADGWFVRKRNKQ